MSRVLTRLADGSGSLLDLATMEFWTLNPTGVRVYELLEAGLSDGDAARRLAEDFAVDEVTALEVVASFRSELEQAGFGPRR